MHFEHFRTRYDNGFFRQGIPTKFDSWGRPAYYSPGGWGDDSSMSGESDRRGRNDFDNYQGKDFYGKQKSKTSVSYKIF